MSGASTETTTKGCECDSPFHCPHDLGEKCTHPIIGLIQVLGLDVQEHLAECERCRLSDLWAYYNRER